jgi:hypothetical protein
MQRVEHETMTAVADQIEAIFLPPGKMQKVHEVGDGESYYVMKVSVSEHDVFRGLARVCRALTST